MRVETQIDMLLEEAGKLAYAEIERRARKLMKDHPRLVTFCMCMGSATFYDKACEPLYLDESDVKYLRPFYNFLDRFDDTLHITGMPLRLRSWDGPADASW